jgi:aspartate carbamoyltransferase regulatory subunit
MTPDAQEDTQELRVAALRHGTVVDHLNAGMALKALEALGLPTQGAALLGIGLESRKMGRKDIMKLENIELKPADVDKLAVFGPNATVSFIRDFKVVRKVNVKLPETIAAILKCPNPNCITNHERAETRFKVETERPLVVRCRYCERRISESEFLLL